MDKHADTATSIAATFAAYPEVQAVALGGSSATAAAEEFSDTDLYVYTAPELAGSPRYDCQAAGVKRSDRDRQSILPDR